MKIENPKSLIPRDECGVVGVWGVPEASTITYLGLYALQHRGQESAGIVTRENGRLHGHRALGLVPDVFNKSVLQSLPGDTAVGHVRYSTTGAPMLENAQPLQIDYRRGGLALAHNGNLVNAAGLRTELERSGAIFHTTVDTEVILHLMARDLGSFEDTLVSALTIAKGAYSMVILTERELVATRDPYGFRPLILGKLGEGWIIASETCAFDLVGAEYVREIKPGEVLIIDERGMRSRFLPPVDKQALCVFELIYFSRPDSVIFGESVYDARIRLGAKLAETHPADADVVISVPDSSNAAAIGYAERSNLPYANGLIRSHYVGRTFIEPDSAIRDFGVRVKYNAVRNVLDGKRVVIVDDSIVRGSTSKKIVRMIRNAGAREVHMRISCPPWIAPCNYGIDTPSADTLIAHNHTIEEIAAKIGVDTLGYLSIEDMVSVLPGHSFCNACFTGKYPVTFEERSAKEVLHKNRVPAAGAA
ncbi:MAG: amidophosphoribosyltransferase [Candidatus Hydrogenedentota bacterium]